MEALRKYAV
uniref:Uncharacterized protein n=1 Tax=Acrobeloides nanus TaxID=290746 RepID=A0A914DHI2_9BILA